MKRSHSFENPATTFSPPSKIQQKVIARNYFPSDVLKYMKQNAKPRMSVKLMEICKYFKFHEFPFFVIKTITHAWGEWTYVTLDDRTVTTMDLAKLPEKLWITKSIWISTTEVNFPALLNKIIVCDATVLHFGSQTIPINTFKPIFGNIKQFSSISTHLKDDEGNDISLEDLFESLPNLERLFLNVHCPSIKSLEHANRVIPPKLKVFRQKYFLEDFNFGNFADFMLQHQNIKYVIKSNRTINITYLNQLQHHVSRIIDGWNCQFLPPAINYPRLSPACHSMLQELHQEHTLF